VLSDADHKRVRPPVHGAVGSRPGGRTARTRDAVLAAAKAELAESGGAAGLTIERIAQRSGVHQATIYRRWGSIDRLVVDLLVDWAGDALPLPGRGSLAGDLRAVAHGLNRLYSDPVNRALIEAVVATAARHAWAGQALHDTFATRLGRMSAVVTAAIERGELPPGTDGEEVIAAVGSAFYFRLLISRRPIDAALAEQTAAAVHAAALAGAFSTPPT
jgi:AcrR family transcriptional regulator